MIWIEPTQPAQQPQISTILEWITSLSTLAAVVLALAVALFGEWMRRVFFKPELNLEAQVRRPDAERVGRQVQVFDPAMPGTLSVTRIGQAWFFRLQITNESRTPARDVQVYLRKVEKADGTVVEKFTPMNLKWANTDTTTRKVLLRNLPVFCDFIHVSDPAYRQQHGEDLSDVPPDRAIMCLDVEATNTAKGHLLGPGAYRFHLYVAAENAVARQFAVEVHYDGAWLVQQDQMFDREIGFRMKKV